MRVSIACEPPAIAAPDAHCAPSRPARKATIEQFFSRAAARIAFVALFGGVLVWVRFFRLLRKARSNASPRYSGNPRRLLLTGTFYNPGWFESHVPPLCASGVLERIIVVCDAPVATAQNVTFVCPPARMRKVLGRTLARGIMIVRVALRERCGVLMGYHIVPNALLCLAVGAALNRRVIYQMTGGPAQVSEGGWQSENALLRRLGGPSRMRTKLMNAIVREMDDVIVRGRRALEFVLDNKLSGACTILPGSIDTARFRPAERPAQFDLITVGRLVQVKRLDRMLALMAELRLMRPEARLCIVGDGPLRSEIRDAVTRLRLDDNVVFAGPSTDVPPLLQDARAFILTSESEGLSIAMIEAMACGLPVFAPDVGDLSMLLHPGQTGEFIDPQMPVAAARIIADTLREPARLRAYAENAHRTAVGMCSVDAVAATWRAVLSAGTKA